ncbi:unnamed protein product [Ambrosiozyma monospora]|uniref:Unnamed protein product n=1 Tax=Ambrosiozyma monospora TaxID=43982 RepID=A0ACB5SXK7_AMBMO|nr:unnamed protein product [Ambrosiozyma monospora]
MSLGGEFKFNFSNSVLFGASKKENDQPKQSQQSQTTKLPTTNHEPTPAQTQRNEKQQDEDEYEPVYMNPNVFTPTVKEFVSSSGQKILLKPKVTSLEAVLSRNDELDNINNKLDDQSSLINMSKLYTKLEIQEKIEQEEQKFKKNSLKPAFTGQGILPISKKQKKNANKLWTEKYRPNNFLDLVGSEKTNRFILQWLTQWNEMALNKPNPPKANSFNGGTNRPNSFQQQQQQQQQPDPFNRPRHKILLIHGPPGIGKTSIAHAIARQLDYYIQEINASDERAGTKVKDKIMNVMKNSNFSGKPACLIVDEIDGASEFGFMKFLNDLIYEDKKATNKVIHERDSKSKKQNDKNVKGLLKRPIIALCNDVYANALEKLKPHCEIVQLRKPPRHLILSTLKKICKKEHLQVSDKFLGFLVDSTDGDLRNCINFLQFNSSSDFLDDAASRLSSKDSQISWFLLLNDVFSRSHRFSKTEQFNSLFNRLSSAPSSIDKVNNGCFNVMLDLENTSLHKLDQTQDWVFFNDIIKTKFSDFERTDLTYYNCVAPMRFFQIFNDIGAINDSKRYSYKSKDETFESKKQISELIRKLRFATLGTNEMNLIKYELPLLNLIMTPVEANNKSLDHNNEKMQHIYNLIDDYHFGFEFKKPEFSADRSRINQTTQIFRPNLDLCSISIGTVDHRKSVLMNKIHTGYTNHANKNNNSNSTTTTEEYILRKRKRKEETAAAEPETKKRPEQGSKGSASAVSTVDFFRSKYSAFASHVTHGKDKDAESSNQEENGAADNKNESSHRNVMNDNENRIWVKYHEGFSNAVRKEIQWQDLF